MLDVLAWYAPIHTHRKNWGIYIRESAVLDLAGRIVARVLSLILVGISFTEWSRLTTTQRRR